MRSIALLLGGALALGLLAAVPSPAPAVPEIGWLGISISEVGEDLAERLGGIFGPAAGNGVQVVEVLPGGPAEPALQRGDVIVEVDAQPIWDVRQLQRIVRATPANRQVVVAVLRGSRRVTVPVTIGAMPAEARAQLAGERFGFLIRERAQAPGADGQDAFPLVVALVEPDSAAARADLKPMDRILEANGRRVATFRDFEQALLESGQSLSLLVQRRDAASPIALHLDLPRR
jgi:S1-C subfamily serine protease